MAPVTDRRSTDNTDLQITKAFRRLWYRWLNWKHCIQIKCSRKSIQHFEIITYHENSQAKKKVIIKSITKVNNSVYVQYFVVVFIKKRPSSNVSNNMLAINAGGNWPRRHLIIVFAWNEWTELNSTRLDSPLSPPTPFYYFPSTQLMFAIAFFRCCVFLH